MAIETNVWIYWSFCAVAMLLVIFGREKISIPLLSPNSISFQKDRGYFMSLGWGWGATMLAAAGYILFTQKYETGNYEIPDLLLFSFSNGVLEQFMFIFWLLIGCYIGKLYVPQKPKISFIFGFIVYAVFSGLIHAFFWTTVLPPHKPVSVVMALVLTMMSMAWMWLFWRYRAVAAIISMHIFVDFFMIGHLHFTWFESLQTLVHL